MPRSRRRRLAGRPVSAAPLRPNSKLEDAEHNVVSPTRKLPSRWLSQDVTRVGYGRLAPFSRTRWESKPDRCRLRNITSRRGRDDTDDGEGQLFLPTNDTRECGGCFGAIAPNLDASRPSPCSADRGASPSRSLAFEEPRLRRASRLRRVPGLPPSG